MHGRFGGPGTPLGTPEDCYVTILRTILLDDVMTDSDHETFLEEENEHFEGNGNVG